MSLCRFYARLTIAVRSFTRVDGASLRSYGSEVALSAGVPSVIVDRAVDIARRFVCRRRYRIVDAVDIARADRSAQDSAAQWCIRRFVDVAQALSDASCDDAALHALQQSIQNGLHVIKTQT